MRRTLALMFLVAALLTPGGGGSAWAQELAFETYTGQGWSIRWDPKIARLISADHASYAMRVDGCNLALAYPNFRLCARSFDNAIHPDIATDGYDQRNPADQVRFLRDRFFPDFEAVPDDATSRPAFASDDRAWQLFADPTGESGFAPDTDAIYIETRRLSPDELVTFVITGLTVEEFEIDAADAVNAVLAGVQLRQPNFTEPLLGWSIAWDPEYLRPSAIPDPDPETTLYLTEYAEAYDADGLDIDIWLADFTLGENEDPEMVDPVAVVNDFMQLFGEVAGQADAELPEGYAAFQISGPERASNLFLIPSDPLAPPAPDRWVLFDIRVIVPGESVLATLLMWDAPHSDLLLPVFDEFMDSISIP